MRACQLRGKVALYILTPCGRAADPSAKLSVFKNVTAGKDETYADVNRASGGAIEIRERWLKMRTHPVFAYTILR